MNKPRLASLRKGDIFTTDLRAIDLLTLKLIHLGIIKPICEIETKVHRFKYFPFLKKRIKSIRFEVIKDQLY